MSNGMLTANAPDPDRVFDPIDGAEDDGGNYNLGYWLAEQFNTFYGPEFDVGDREYSPEEIEEIQELFRKIREGELVDLSEIQEDFPDFYEYLSEQPGFEQYFEGDDSQLIQGISTWGNIVDALLEAGYDQEFIDELIYDPENGVLFDRTNQNAVTLENILENLTGNDWDVLQLPTEGDNGTFRADMDGDGVYDTVVRCTSGAGSACAIEDYQVVYGAEVDMTDPEVQDQIRNAAIYEESQGTEGWEDLEDWEKNQILKDGGYTGPFVFGDGSTMPPDEPDEEQDSSVIEQIQENFPTFEDLWEKIYEQLPDLSDPEQVAEVISTILDVTGTYSVEDISTILAGGYGVIWDPAGDIFTNPGTGSVFVPGLPAGLPPSSVVIGTINDLIGEGEQNPVQVITDRINEIWGGIVADPGGFIQGILTGALEVPPELWEMILGGVTIGQELYDWLTESGIDHTQPSNVPPLGGAADGNEEEKESFNRIEQTESLLGDMTAAFGDTTAEEDPFVNVEDQDQYGFPGAQTAEEDIVGDDSTTESPLSGEGQTENTLSDLISGFDSIDSDLTFGGGIRQEEIGSDPTLSQGPEDTLSGSSDGGGSSGGGGGASKPYEFMARLNYLLPEAVPIISQGQVDFNSSMFNAPQQKRKGLQLGSITESLFERFI